MTDVNFGELSAEEAAREAYAHILARAPEHDFEPTLDRVREACALLGDPEAAFRVIHVTGTNGKTSTSRMIERLVRAHGLRTGRFTSPHLTTVRERIAIDGEPISAERFVEVWQEVAPIIHIVDTRSRERGGPAMSFFEVLTVMAYAAFADAPVEVAIVEVGMGGTWDATNVATGDVAVVTPISRDHERWLGYELTSIAREKAGIIKPGATAVIAEQRDEVEGVLLEAAEAEHAVVRREGIDLEVVSRQVAVGGQLIALRTTMGFYPDLYLPLHGQYQAHNALLALAAAEALLSDGEPLDPEVVAAAFAAVDSPGRLELLRTSPTILVDAAHNPAGAEALVGAIEEAFDFTRLVGVVGILEDKDAESVLSALEPLLAEIVITRSTSVRALDVTDLAELAEEVFGEGRVHAVERLDDAIDLAVQRAESEEPYGSGVLITGSITLAAEARILLGRP
jgi:dihydrofolate synthase/folylpolyglutamate synthase